MTFYLIVDVLADEIVSHGRTIGRCYKCRNVTEWRGHAPGTLKCQRVEARSYNGGQRYLVELTEVAPEDLDRSHAVADFRCLDRGIDAPSGAAPLDVLPPLSRPEATAPDRVLQPLMEIPFGGDSDPLSLNSQPSTFNSLPDA